MMITPATQPPAELTAPAVRPGAPRPDREKVVAYIRRKGVVGHLSEAFIADIDWSVRARALAQALSVTTCYPNSPEGAQAYIDDLLSLHSVDLDTIPQDANVRILSRWIEGIRQEILADGEVAT